MLALALGVWLLGNKYFRFQQCCAEEVYLKARAYVLNILSIDRGKSNGTRESNLDSNII